MTDQTTRQKTRYRPKQKPQVEIRQKPPRPPHEQSKQKKRPHGQIETKAAGGIAWKAAPKVSKPVVQQSRSGPPRSGPPGSGPPRSGAPGSGPPRSGPPRSEPSGSRPSSQQGEEKVLPTDLELFLVAVPGLESQLAAEAKERGFRQARVTPPGGVTVRGGWPEVWRANLELRGASRVLVRVESFRAAHLSELAKRARAVAWGAFLKRDVPFDVEVSCSKSRIYHSGAAAERITTAIHEALGATPMREAEVVIKARIDSDICTISLDTSGELLHKREHKQAVSKAPMRETMAAMFLRQCGFDCRAPIPVLDPMCGSGTFVIEAAEMAVGLLPGRSRAFAFEQLATFDRAAWEALRSRRVDASLGAHARRSEGAGGAARFFGFDRDAGAVRMSRANAERAGIGGVATFEERDVAELEPPEGPPGLVIVNPPYGGRIGDAPQLSALYRTLGATLRTRFAGWRVGLITSDAALASATGLPFEPPAPPVVHGGIKVRLYQAGPLGLRGD